MPFRRSQRDFNDEIRSHLELETARLQAQGMSAVDAERAARRRFGNVGMAQDRFYYARRLASLDAIVRDVRHALRSLRRTPGFLATSVITLALAIGALTGMYSVVDNVLLRPLNYPNQDRLVFLLGTAPGSDLPERFDLGDEFYLHFKENSRLLDGIFAFAGGNSTFRVGDRVERVPMAWPTNDMYATLGATVQLGRLPRSEDSDDAVVLGDSVWNSWFARDSSVIGKWYFVNDSLKQVIGVMAPGFAFPGDATQLWISGEIRADGVRPGRFGTAIVGRLKPGVTREQLAAELHQLAKQLPARFGDQAGYGETIARFRPVILPMLEVMVGPAARTSLLVLLGGVAIVLLIACANVANLFLVRAETRRRDIVVRRAIGASSAQLLRFQMAESLVVALIAGLAAVAVAKVALPFFVSAAPERIPRLSSATIDLPAVGVTFAVVLLVALICGAAPAFRAATSDLAGLKDGGRAATGTRRLGRNALVVAQTALALVLLIGSALLVQSFRRLRNVDPGYQTKDLYTFQFAPDQPQLNDGAAMARLHFDMMSRLRALPGVTAVGVVNNLPLDEGTGNLPVFPDGATSGNPVQLDFNIAAGDYFKAMGIALLDGRAFDNAETVSPHRNVLLSQAAAERLWPGQPALGRTLRPRVAGQDSISFSVIGIVNDVRQDDWRDDGEAVMYFSLTGPTASAWRIGSPAYVVRSARSEQLRDEVRRLVHEVAPEAPVYREFTMDFLAQRAMRQLSFTSLTLGVLSTLALILGVVGLYGVLSYAVAQREREIGVQMALGATAGRVRRQFVAHGARVVVTGAAIGLVGAGLATGLLTRLLYGVRALDPIVFITMSAIVVGVGIVASYVPAHRASGVDPIKVLRSD